VSEAAINTGVDVTQIEFNAPKNLPSFDEKYQRGTGVLDIFVGPESSIRDPVRAIGDRS